jgi:hypothetical protein
MSIPPAFLLAGATLAASILAAILLAAGPVRAGGGLSSPAVRLLGAIAVLSALISAGLSLAPGAAPPLRPAFSGTDATTEAP